MTYIIRGVAIILGAVVGASLFQHGLLLGALVAVPACFLIGVGSAAFARWFE